MSIKHKRCKKIVFFTFIAFKVCDAVWARTLSFKFERFFTYNFSIEIQNLTTKPNTQDNRIIGGNLAANNSYPWMVALLRSVESTYRFTCGGSIISSNWVLTAAHCVYSEVIDSPKFVLLRVFLKHLGCFFQVLAVQVYLEIWK